MAQKNSKKIELKNKKNLLLTGGLAVMLASSTPAHSQTFGGLPAQEAKAEHVHDREINTGLILGTMMGVQNTYAENLENRYLEIGFQQSTKNIGVGATIAFPVKETNLGVERTETRKPRLYGPNPYTQVIDEVVESIGQKTFYKSRLTFNNDNFSFFLTQGMQQDKYTDLITKITHREYIENDGMITKTPKIIGPTNQITEITNYFIAGFGIELQTGSVKSYIDFTRTFGKVKNETYVGFGFKLDFLKTRRQNK